MITVYILRLSNGKNYTGMTMDMERRLGEHQSGQSKSTKRHLPVKVIHQAEYPNRILARKQEVSIKKQGAKRYLAKLKFNPSPSDS